MRSQPDPRRNTRRTESLWIIRGLLFGMPVGVLMSIAVNHGHPHLDGLYALIPVLVLYSAFVSLMLDVDARPWRAIAPRAAVVLVGGSVLFMLPRFLTLPATGHIWQSSAVLRYFICCAPYPLLGWLAGPLRERAVTVAVSSGLAATVLAWPLLIVSMRDLAAEQVRTEIGAPSSMLLTLHTPAAYPGGGYVRSGDVVWMSFDSAGANGGFSMGQDYYPDDLDMYVFPVTAASPCSLINPIFQNTIGFDAPDGVCTHTAANLWVARNTPEDGAVTDIEQYHGYYVALSVDAASTRPIPPSALVSLLATAHPADDSELASVGTCSCSFW